MKTTRLCWMALLALALFAGAVPPGSPAVRRYRLTEILRERLDFHPHVSDINNRGVVSGWVYDGESVEDHPFRWKAGELNYLPRLLNAFPPGGAYGINDRGHIVGVLDEGASPAIWRGEQFTVLPLLPGVDGGRAFAINDPGRIVGTLNQAGGALTLPVRWDDEQPVRLGLLPGDTDGAAFTVNDTGVAAGYSGLLTQEPSTFAAVVWRTTEAEPLPNPRPGTNSVVYSINDRGQMVGQVGDALPVLWSGGGARVLRLLGGDRDGAAFDINNEGVAAGRSGRRAAIWRGGRVTDLNRLIPSGSSWRLQEAVAINDRGLILVSGDRPGRILPGQPRTRVDGVALLTPE